MLIDGYMFTGRVGLGSHRRDADELFIIWYGKGRSKDNEQLQDFFKT